MKRFRVLLIAAAVAAASWMSPAEAQTVVFNGAVMDASEVPADLPSTEVVSGLLPQDPQPRDPSWGTQDWDTVTVGAGDLVRRWGCDHDGEPDISNLDIVRPSSDTGACIGWPVHLPTGAHLETVRLIYYDDVAASEPNLGFWRSDLYGPKESLLSLSPSAFSGGNRYVDFAIDLTVANQNTSYFVLAMLDQSGAAYQGVYGLTFWYHLQVSPAPATATFNDVPPSHPYFQWIEALAASGITAGCGSGNYCPDNPLTRGQMAVFLSRALGLHWSQ